MTMGFRAHAMLIFLLGVMCYLNIIQLLIKIQERFKLNPADYRICSDLHAVCFEMLQEENCSNEKLIVQNLRALSEQCERNVRFYLEEDLDRSREFVELHKEVLLTSAPHDLHSYCQYIEWNREPNKKFYAPRMKQLKPLADAMQRFNDDEIELLCISLPPGVGKTTMGIFFMTYLAGIYPDAPILGASHSNSFLRGVYDECLRIIKSDGEYLWSDVFPNVPLADTNAKDMRIDLGSPKRFQTLEFSSIGSGNAGKVRAQTLLYCDDLVEGMEAALSRERMDKLWTLYNTDLRQRKIGNCKELHIATRWSLHDVIGRLQEKYKGSDRAEFIAVPALNENDESNFDYGNSAGFTTQFYLEQRSLMDSISWKALYQNQPIEREGLLYDSDELLRYTDLPVEAPDSILAVCDTKDRGNDYCVMPIAYQYGQNYYIEDFICDDSNPDVLEERLAQKLVEHHVNIVRFESNSAGGRIAENVQKLLEAKHSTTQVTTQYSTANKETRIITAAGFAKKHFYFKDEQLYRNQLREYRDAMSFLTGYTMKARNAHDDVPDAISMLVNLIESFADREAEIFQRPF